MSSTRAHAVASQLSQSQSGSGSLASIPHFVKLDFAYATRSVLYVMAAIMAVAAIVALLGLRHGVQEEPPAHERDVDDPAVEQATLA